MFQHWTFAHPGAPNEGRAERYAADLRVAVVVPFESWQLMWNVRSLNISHTGILCIADVHDPVTAQQATDLDTILDAEPEVHLQIESPSHEVFSANIDARVVRKTKKQWGLEVALHFHQESDDLFNLIANLDQTDGPFGRRTH